MVHVFVYGTLKRGFPFYELGLSAEQYLGPVKTVQPYPMLIALSFYGPVMLDQPGKGRHVTGELFNVSEATLPTLDKLEDVGKPGSFRSVIAVEPLTGGLRLDAIGYMKDETWLDPVHSDYLSDYQDRRFIPPWKR